MKRVVILISGGGTNMVALVRDMVGDHPARPVLVVSNDAASGGLDRAQELGVPTALVDHRDYPDRLAFEAALAERIDAAAPDVICLAGFLRILSPGFVQRYQGRMLNIHPSLLPLYPGLNTHARVLAAGDPESGCTVHEVTEVLDGGPILGQARVPVRPFDSPGTLGVRVLMQEHKLYPAVLRRFAQGDRTPVLLP